MNDNVLRVAFGSSRMITSNALWQYDYGQVLQIRGITLPELYEVHFSVSDSGNAYVSIGDENGVDIPDELLETGDSIYAHIYLHTGTDDGETEYRIVIPVHKRAKPTHETPTPVQQSEIERLIALAEYIIEHGVNPSGGSDGFSPVVEITDITGGHKISITDKTHTVTADVMDGKKGDNGKGIVSIEKTSTSGLVDTYTITYTDNNTSTYTVTNGKDGTNGENYVLTAQDKADIAALVVQLIPSAESEGF